MENRKVNVLYKLRQGAALLLVSFISCNSAEYPIMEDGKIRYFCDAEGGKKCEVFTIGNGTRIKHEQAHSGKYVIRLSGKSNYGFSIRGEHVVPGTTYEVSVWRKCAENDKEHARLVVSDQTAKTVYKATKVSFEQGKNGWEKLSMFYVMPPNVTEETRVTIYAWYNGKKEAFFDDLEIIKHESPTYPSYKEEAIELTVTAANYQQLVDWRKIAFQHKNIPSECKKKLPAEFQWGKEKFPSKIRFKGDWLDHLQGEKWSFRVQLAEGNTWNGMKTFSVHTPAARYYVGEWLLHRLFEQEDILTTKYDFVPLKLNGKSLGMYAYEEHFDYRLLDRYQRTRAPILKLSEDGMWERNIMMAINSKFASSAPFYESSVIEPFYKGWVFDNDTLEKYFIRAQNLLHAYQTDAKAPSQVFDLDRMAKYLALCDLFLSYHGLVWHNIRFYYNPKMDRLEPIAYDCNFQKASEKGQTIYGYHPEKTRHSIGHDKFFTMKMMNDREFQEKYLMYLEKYINSDYLENTLKSLEKEIDYRNSLMQKEFSYFFSPELYVKKREKILSVLDNYRAKVKGGYIDFVFKELLIEYRGPAVAPLPNISLKAYREKENKEEQRLTLSNYHVGNIRVVGFGDTDTSATRNLESPVELKAFKKELKGTGELNIPASADFLYYEVEGLDSLFIQEIYSWPSPKVQ